jgi:hypothetical protein
MFYYMFIFMLLTLLLFNRLFVLMYLQCLNLIEVMGHINKVLNLSRVRIDVG